MKRIIHTDTQGRVVVRLLRDADDESNPGIGIPVEPPPIERIVRESALEVQNELVRRGILNYRDVVAAQSEVSNVLNGVLRKKIIEAYKLKELEENGQSKL